jgi:L-fuconolactonase
VAGPNPRAEVVDAHLHVWRAEPGAVSDVPTPVGPGEDVSVERMWEVLTPHGVGRAVLVQPVYRGEDNAYVADAAAGDPGRLAAVCVVDPRVPGAETRLEQWTGRGCRGLRLRPKFAAESAAFGDPSTFPLWEKARALGVVVSVLADPVHVPVIDALAGRFPEVAVVVDHLAHPDVSEGVAGAGFRALLGLARHPRVFVKVSGYYHFSKRPDPFEDCWELLRAVYDEFGPGRLIWGSDFPHVERRGGYGRALEVAARDLPFFSTEDRAKVLGGNARALYWPGGGTA